MLCSRCGSHLKDGEQVCPTCNQAVSNRPMPSKNKGGREKKLPSFWLRIVLGLIILGCLALGLDSFFHNDLSQVAEKQLAAIRSDDVDAAYYQYTSNEFQSTTSRQGFHHFLRAYPVFTHNRTATFDLEQKGQNHGSVRGLLVATNGKTMPFQYHFVKEEGTWKILSMEPLPSKEDIQQKATLKEELSPPIKALLKALHEGQIDQGYQDNTSKDFKGATSLPDFKAFVKNYPILTEYESMSFEDASLEKNYGKLHVLLTLKEENIPVEFTLIKEDDHWKVYGFNILFPPSQNKVNQAQQEEFVSVIRAQLDALQHNELSKSYDEYASTEFKKVTSREAYEKFVREYPILTHFQSIDIEEVSLDNDHAMADLYLKADENKTHVKYHLIKEDGKWKVYGFRVVVDTPTPTSVLADSEKTQEISSTVQAQLKLLKNHDLSSAYYSYVSKEFQEAMSLDAFQEFVKKYSILTDYESMVLGKPLLENQYAILEVVLSDKNGPTNVKYTLIKNGDNWKIYGFKLILAPKNEEKDLSSDVKEDVEKVVQAQLDSLKKHDASKAYYGYTSKKFQEATTLDVFKEYVKEHPIFENPNLQIQFEKSYMIDGHPLIQAKVKAQDEEDVLEYAFEKQDNQWKILSMEVNPQPEPTTPPYFNSDDLLNTIQKQLEAIRSQDLSKAYYTYTTKSFQQATPFKTFEEFVKSQPIFSNNKTFSVSKFNVEHEIGTFVGTLIAKDNQSLRVEYQMEFEDGIWKILHIQVLQDNE